MFQYRSFSVFDVVALILHFLLVGEIVVLLGNVGLLVLNKAFPWLQHLFRRYSLVAPFLLAVLALLLQLLSSSSNAGAPSPTQQPSPVPRSAHNPCDVNPVQTLYSSNTLEGMKPRVEAIAKRWPEVNETFVRYEIAFNHMSIPTQAVSEAGQEFVVLVGNEASWRGNTTMDAEAGYLEVKKQSVRCLEKYGQFQEAVGQLSQQLHGIDDAMDNQLSNPEAPHAVKLNPESLLNVKAMTAQIRTSMDLLGGIFTDPCSNATVAEVEQAWAKRGTGIWDSDKLSEVAAKWVWC